MPQSQLPYGLPAQQSVPLALILGTNEIASAVAISMHAAGFGVIMSHDPHPPVIRRGMAFHDALYGDEVSIGPLSAVGADTALVAASEALSRQRVVVTRLHVMELFTIKTIDALIDARMQKDRVTPDLNNLAAVAVGLGPGFAVGKNCDVAIETKPGKEGLTLHKGETLVADGISRQLGGAGRERFIYAPCAGKWTTALDVGTRVFKDYPLGVVGSNMLVAPFDGILRGIARDSIQVMPGVKLVEIDPRGRHAQWQGIDERGRLIADAAALAAVGYLQRKATIKRFLQMPGQLKP